MKQLTLFLVIFLSYLNLQASSDDLKNAIQKNNIEKFNEILSEKPELINTYKNSGRNIVFDILYRGDYSILLKEAIVLGADVHALSSKNTNSVHESVWRKRHKCLELLLAAKVKVDLESNQLQTPMIYAIIKGDLKSVKMLVEAGADIKSLTGKRKFSVLRHAIWQKKDDIALYFLEKKVEPSADLESPNAEALVFDAAEYDCPKTLDNLLVSGFSSNSVNKSKDSVLYLAVSYGNIECVKVLIKHGVNIDKSSEKKIEKLDNNEIIDLIDNYRANQ